VRALIVITDSEAVRGFERALLESGDRGFTIVPTVWGRGRTGLKAGDRVHPGGSSLLFSVVPDAEAEATLRFLREVRDRLGVAESTKIFATRVDELG
jgi:hypothetical protein